MKRSLIRRALALLLTLAIAAVAVCADVIYEPNNDFYSDHADECEYDGGMYILNGAEGNVTVYLDPLSQSPHDIFQNGAELQVSATYTDASGTKWGCVEYTVENGGEPVTAYNAESGWVKIEDMAFVYGNAAFLAEHEGELTPWDGDRSSIDAAESVIFWTYPGSGEEVVSMKPTDLDEGFDFAEAYTDVDGRLWGYVSYYRSLEGWICLSEPANDDLPLHRGENTGLIAPVAPAPMKAGVRTVTVALIALVVLLAAGMTVLLVLLSRKNKKAAAGK